MSTSDSPIRFQLRILVADEYKYLVKILVFDSGNRIISPVEESEHKYQYQLKKGLYIVRVEMNAEINDKIITLNADKDFLVSSRYSSSSQSNIIEPPQKFSSALLSGENIKTYSSSHEYYTLPAIILSKRDTFTYNAINISPSNSSLFIFMRFSSVEKYDTLKSKWAKSFYQDFEIVDEFGGQILKFDSQIGLEVNEDFGWLAFNAMLPNGVYYLIYHGIEPRQIPIYVFKNWHTQFFMTLGDVPLFGTTRIFISAYREFNPKAETNKYIDILLDKLQNGDYSVDEELIKITAYGKYESPMLGLICSYVYFKSPQKRNNKLFNIIIKNLQRVILKDNDESPDLRALKILAAEHYSNTKFKKTAINGTPMLRIGFEVINNASVKNRSLISKKSINDFISETLYYDSPFNTFKPIPVYKKPKDEISMSIKLNNKVISVRKISSEKDKPDKGFKEISPKGDSFEKSIQNLLKPNVIKFIKSYNVDSESEKNWVRTTISDLLNQNDNLSINDISSQLNLSGNTISRIFDDWKKEIKDKK